jgi:hypothetical protein
VEEISMPITITSLQLSGPLVIPLASGASLRLAPGATSAPLAEADIVGNPKIEKLTAQGAIAVNEPSKPAARGRGGGRSADAKD